MAAKLMTCAPKGNPTAARLSSWRAWAVLPTAKFLRLSAGTRRLTSCCHHAQPASSDMRLCLYYTCPIRGRKGPAMTGEMSLFGPDPNSDPVKPADGRAVRLRILITVKASPNPSETYGETVCVAGLRVDLDNPGWIRLYPINFRELDSNQKFAKYDIVSLEARPNRSDPRAESWRPQMATLRKEAHLAGWPRRLGYVGDYIEGSMCGLLDGIRDRPPAKSLAAVRPRQVTSLDIEPHPGWTPGEQAKIDRYVNQLELPGMEKAPRVALEPA